MRCRKCKFDRSFSSHCRVISNAAAKLSLLRRQCFSPVFLNLVIVPDAGDGPGPDGSVKR